MAKIIEMADYLLEDLEMDSYSSVHESLREQLNLLKTHTDSVDVLRYLLALDELLTSIDQMIAPKTAIEMLGKLNAQVAAGAWDDPLPSFRAPLDEALEDAPARVKAAWVLIVNYLECVTGSAGQKV